MSSEQPEIIRRPDKGLTISGTRTTIYAVMDYVQANDSRENMLLGLNLTDAQLDAALAYIAANRDAVNAEYQHVLQLADEHRRVAEEQLRDHLARTPHPPITPEKAALYAKLVEQQRQTIRELLDALDKKPTGTPTS